MATYDLVLNNIYQPQNIFLLDAIFKIVSPHSERIAKKFYYEMLDNENAAVFLHYDEVKNRLTASMICWIKAAFVYLDSQKQIEEYRYYQQKIGQIHKKIGVPVSLVNYAMYIIKQDICFLLVDSALSRSNLGSALILANQILDCSLQIINESYEMS